MTQLLTTHVPGLVAHFERVLGPVATGWLRSPLGEQMRCQVVRWQRGPDVGSVAYSTLGLSRRTLRRRAASGEWVEVRQEFLMLTTKSLPVEYVLSTLHEVATEVLRSGVAVDQGQVLSDDRVHEKGPAFVPGTRMTSLYVAAPVYFDDEFAVYDDTASGSGGVEVEVMWLVPITAAEDHYVRRAGWEAFEDLLVDQDPDLVDVHRGEVALPD